MTFHIWILFAMAILIASFSPGPNVLIVVINALKYGKLGALFTIFGNLCCLFCIALLASIGVGAAIATAPIAYTIMKIVGGFYLAWLGFKMIKSSFGTLDRIHIDTATKKNIVPNGFILFWESFTVSASNPKSILFLTAVFPQFLDTSHSVLPQFITMFATIITIVFIIHGTYALLAISIREKPISQRFRRWLARITGATFIGLGAGVALSK